MRYWPAERTLAVPRDGRLLLVNPERGVEHPLDEFGADAWELMATGAAFADLVAGVAARRGETHAHARGLLQEWLADLLALGLVRRGTCGEGGESTAEGA